MGQVADTDPAVLPMYQIRRRKKLYLSFFQNKQEARPYKSFDVPAIAAKFLPVWEHVVMSSNMTQRRSFKAEDLHTMEADFRIMLVASNICGKFVFGEANDIMTSLSTRRSRLLSYFDQTQVMSRSARSCVSVSLDKISVDKSSVPQTPTMPICPITYTDSLPNQMPEYL